MEDLSYYDVCRAKGVDPLQEVKSVLSQKDSTLVVPPSTPLKDPHFVCLSSFFQDNLKFLTKVVIQGQKISPESFRVLVSGLKTNSYIESLVLSSNELSDTSSLSCVSELLSTLKELDLSDNKLDDGSANSLCEGVASSCSLEVLNLSYNQIKNSNIPFALSKNQTLQEFYMSHNPLSLKLILATLDSLKRNHTLKHLGVVSNFQVEPSSNFYREVTFKLAEVIRCFSLQSIQINLSCSESEAMKDIEEALKHNRTLTQIDSPEIDWNRLAQKPILFRIYRALKANQLVTQETHKKLLVEDLEQEETDKSLVSASVFGTPRNEKTLTKLNNYIEQVCNRLSHLEQNLSNNQSQLSESRSFLERLQSKLHSFEDKFLQKTKHDQKVANNLEKRIQDLEKKDQVKQKLLKEINTEVFELKETSSETNLKVDKAELKFKQQITLLQQASLPKQEAKTIKSTHESIIDQMQNITNQMQTARVSLKKLKTSVEHTKKVSSQVQKLKEDQEAANSVLSKKIKATEDKDDQLLELRTSIYDTQNYLKKRLQGLENHIWENSDYEALKESFMNSARALQSRLLRLEEKAGIWEEHSKLTELENRISKLENSQKAPEPKETEPKDYTCTAETLVRKSLEKNTFKEKFRNSLLQTKAISPVTQSFRTLSNLKNPESPLIPSEELRESLATKGFTVHYN